MERNTCKNCVYFCSDSTSDPRGTVCECHYCPPVVAGTGNGIRSMFPRTSENSIACHKYLSLEDFERGLKYQESARQHLTEGR